MEDRRGSRGSVASRRDPLRPPGANDTSGAVPRETDRAIGVVFGDRRGLAERFVHHLSTTGVEHGLVGPRELPRLWERHVLNCAAIHPLLAPGATVIDVGSGAGLPGLALVIARPDLRMTLVEPLLRRATWLANVTSDLELAGVSVVRGRAEDLSGRRPADAVTARAVAGLATLAGWCLPLLRPGGRLLAIKGRSAEGELAASVGTLQSLGATRWSIESCSVPGLDEATTVTVVTAGGRVRTSRPPR